MVCIFIVVILLKFKMVCIFVIFFSFILPSQPLSLDGIVQFHDYVSSYRFLFCFVFNPVCNTLRFLDWYLLSVLEFSAIVSYFLSFSGSKLRYIQCSYFLLHVSSPPLCTFCFFSILCSSGLAPSPYTFSLHLFLKHRH